MLQPPLYHSGISRLGPLRRHNLRLMHCTYFLGLTNYHGRVLASYGVNDRSFGVAELKEDFYAN